MNKNFGHHIRLCWRFQTQTIRSSTTSSFHRFSLPARPSSLSTTIQMQSATFSTQMDERSLSRTTSEKVAEEQGRQDMRWLLESMSGSREVSYWLEHYSTPPEDSTAVNNLAVIKVGGGVVEDDAQLNDLCSSLAFLKRSGLNPIVIHGAGPQLNADLESQGIVSEYIEGIRITTPEILRTARRVFLDVNRKLVDALEARGTRARFIDPSVFEADFVDQKHYGLVGEIKNVRHEWIGDAIDSGYLPVVCSLAESDTGQTLNVNADVAAVRLAEVMVPMKMIYINTMGGLLDGDDQLMSKQQVVAVRGEFVLCGGARCIHLLLFLLLFFFVQETSITLRITNGCWPNHG
jgi:acetylglutamate kinase